MGRVEKKLWHLHLQLLKLCSHVIDVIIHSQKKIQSVIYVIRAINVIRVFGKR